MKNARALDELLLVFLGLTVVLVPLLYPEFSLGSITITITDLATLLLGIGFLLRLTQRKLDLKPTKVDIVFFALIIWGAISLLKTVNLPDSMRDFLWLLNSGLVFYIVSHADLKEDEVIRIFRTACYGAALIAVMSIWQHYVLHQRTYFTLHNANHLAGYLIFYLPILIGFKYGKRVDQRFFWGILATVVSTALVVTYTRGGWIAAIISLVVMAVMKDKKLLIFLIIYIMAYTWLFTPVGNRDIFVTNGMAVGDRALSILKEHETANGQYRIQLWLTALQMFRDNPMDGVGIGNYYNLHDIYLAKYPYLDRGRPARNPHSSFLKILAETGIIGFALFMGLLVAVAKQSFMLWYKLGSRGDALIVGFICGAGAVIIQANTNILFHLSRGVFGVWVGSALVMQLAKEAQTASLQESVPAKGKWFEMNNVARPAIGKKLNC
ncbi:O-antigen ligase family protein [Metallumcola ferriviriculae]|uniref:O-antigen ligase family protein n=1 Tax=Metallumcola ferriviriculae TaxID=3039180 RepID=A0AAU0UNB0_9FIRM|nr:O-antigen ligase family protein [Desulfitibacteraceae bacterium MK1]